LSEVKRAVLKALTLGRFSWRRRTPGEGIERRTVGWEEDMTVRCGEEEGERGWKRRRVITPA
jgi:hypothetical protein